MSETTMEKPYNFRPLEAGDVFLMAKVIGAIGVNEFTACFDKGDFARMITAVGNESGGSTAIVGATVFFEIANVIFNNLPKCEADIYKLLASVSGMAEKDIKKMEFVPFLEMIIEFVQKEEFRDFIKVVSRLFK